MGDSICFPLKHSELYKREKEVLKIRMHLQVTCHSFQQTRRQHTPLQSRLPHSLILCVLHMGISGDAGRR